MKKVLLIVAAVRGGDAGAAAHGRRLRPFWDRYAAALAGVGAAAAVRSYRTAAARQPAARPVCRAPRRKPKTCCPPRWRMRTQQARMQGLRGAGRAPSWPSRVRILRAGRSGSNAGAGGGELAALPFALAVGVLADNGRVPFEAALQAVHAARSRIRAGAIPGRTRHARASHCARRHRCCCRMPMAMWHNTFRSACGCRCGAGDAWLWGRDDQALRVDCCMVARLDDWMRLGDLLLGAGHLRRRAHCLAGLDPPVAGA